MMSRRYLTSLLACAFLLVDQAFADDWAAYESDSFTVYSNAPAREAVRMIENFEVFRSVAFMMLGLPDEPENARLRIFVFDRQGDFRRVNSDSRIIGFFFHSIFGPRMIVGPQSDDGTQETLYHEYVHYLMNQHFFVNYPRWYSEGFAELLSTVEIESNSIVVGRVPFAGFWSPAPLRDVIENTASASTGTAFYQTAWLMVHHFLIESYRDPTRAQQTAEYIRRYDAGEDPLEAFLDSYDTTLADMRSELNFQPVDFRFDALTLPRIEYEGEVRQRTLDPGEDRYLLGDLTTELDEFESAHRYFDEFEELGIDSPMAINVKSRRAIVYIHENRIEEGDARMEELLELDPDDADVLADIAHYAFDRYNHAIENSEPDAIAYLQRSIEFGERAIEQNSGDLEALFYLGLSYELQGDLQRAADTLLRSYDINPSVPTLNAALAQVLIRGRQIELASYLLSRIYSATHSEELRAQIRRAQEIIHAEDFDPAHFEDFF